MENRELDQWFKTGLETTTTYHSAEEQWEVVAARLAQPGRRKPAWWWLLGAGLGIVVLILVVVPRVLSRQLSGLGLAQTLQSGYTDQSSLGKSPNHFKIGIESQPVIGAFQIPIASTKASPVDAVASRGDSSAKAESDTQEAKQLPVSAKKIAPVVARNEEQSQRVFVPTTGLRQEATTEQAYEQGKGAPMAKTLVDLGAEPMMITRSETDPLFRAVSTIMTLPLREIVSDAVPDTSLPAEVELAEALVAVVSSPRWSLEAGVQQDFVPSGRITSDARLQYYSALAFNFLPQWQARLAYGAGRVERTITGDPLAYRVPIVDAPQEEDIPSTTQLRYRNQNVEVQLAYHLPKLKKLSFAINTGLQWNKDTDLNAVYDYEGIYQPVTVEATLPDAKLLLSDFTVGVDLRYPLTPVFGLQGGFQQYFSLKGSDVFRWPLRRRVQIGLSYQF